MMSTMSGSGRSAECGPCQLPQHKVVSDLLLGDVAQRVVQRLAPHLAVLAIPVQPHRDADAIPQRAEPGVVDLHLEAGCGDRFVLHAHRLGDGVDVLLVGRVDAFHAARFDAERRRRREERIEAGVSPSAPS
jgi:hypothetical protein